MTVRLLVTGANGFLGSEVVRQFNRTGFYQRTLDRDPEPTNSDVEYIQIDIQYPEIPRSIFAEIDCVIHAAGLAHVFKQTQSMAALFKVVNEIGTANVIGAAGQAGVRHFVLVSSVSVYGGICNGSDETAECHPEGPYPVSKWQAERRAIEIAQSFGMNLTILRLATLYGEGDPGNVARLMKSIDRGRFVWVGDGSNRKSLLHRKDAARGILAAVTQPQNGIEIYNLSAPPCTVRQIVDELAIVLGKRVFGWHVPGSLALCMSRVFSRLTRGKGTLDSLHSILQKWLADDVYDASKFEHTFDFQTKINLEEGLRCEVAWYRNQIR